MGIKEHYRPPVVHNEANQRFEMSLGGKWAFLDYRWRGDKLALVHTEVPDGFQGQGIGRELATAALQFARREGREVLPDCPFVAHFISKNPEYLELVGPEHRLDFRFQRSA